MKKILYSIQELKQAEHNVWKGGQTLPPKAKNYKDIF